VSLNGATTNSAIVATVDSDLAAVRISGSGVTKNMLMIGHSRVAANGTDISPDSATLIGSGNYVMLNGVSLTGVLAGLNDVTISSPTNGQMLAYNGSVWTNQAGPAVVKGTILAEIMVTTGNKSATSTTLTALDTTNFTLPFTAITTAVDIELTANVSVSGNGTCNFALLDHSNHNQVGDTKAFSVGTSEFPPMTFKWHITGLSAGNSYQYDLAAATAIATFTVSAVSGTGYQSGNGYGGLSMRAIAA
jgi:hypothetical protein